MRRARTGDSAPRALKFNEGRTAAISAITSALKKLSAKFQIIGGPNRGQVLPEVFGSSIVLAGLAGVVAFSLSLDDASSIGDAPQSRTAKNWPPGADESACDQLLTSVYDFEPDDS
jgi:hypothetical protein